MNDSVTGRTNRPQVVYRIDFVPSVYGRQWANMVDMNQAAHLLAVLIYESEATCDAGTAVVCDALGACCSASFIPVYPNLPNSAL